MTTLRCAQFAQRDRGRIARVRHFCCWLGLSGRLLNDLPRQLVGIARALTCSGRHAPIVAHIDASFSGLKNVKLDHYLRRS